MLKTLLFSLSIVVISTIYSQLELTSDTYPFNGLYEWQGVGTVITSSDPNERQRDFNIWLLNNSGEVQWREKFYPKMNQPYPIVGHNSSYIYFLDNLKPENHKIHYHQINMSGSVKSSQVDLLGMIKKAGYNSTEDVQLIDVINAPGALIFQFEAENKMNKSLDQMFVFLTHHNHRTYFTKSIEIGLDGLKNSSEGRLFYAGADDETIYFSRYIKRANQHTLEFIPFTAKAEMGLAQVFTIDKFHNNSGVPVFLNYSGEQHLNRLAKTTTSLGGFYFNKRFYFSGFDKNYETWGVSIFNDKGKQETLYELKLSEQKKRKGSPSIFFGQSKTATFVGFNYNEDQMMVRVTNDGAKPLNISEVTLAQLQNNPSISNVSNSAGIFVHQVNDDYFRLVLESSGKSNTLIFEK